MFICILAQTDNLVGFADPNEAVAEFLFRERRIVPNKVIRQMKRRTFTPEPTKRTNAIVKNKKSAYKSAKDKQ